MISDDATPVRRTLSKALAKDQGSSQSTLPLDVCLPGNFALAAHYDRRGEGNIASRVYLPGNYFSTDSHRPADMLASKDDRIQVS